MHIDIELYSGECRQRGGTRERFAQRHRAGSDRALRDEEYAGKSLQMDSQQREPEFASQITVVYDSVGRVPFIVK